MTYDQTPPRLSSSWCVPLILFTSSLHNFLQFLVLFFSNSSSLWTWYIERKKELLGISSDWSKGNGNNEVYFKIFLLFVGKGLWPLGLYMVLMLTIDIYICKPFDLMLKSLHICKMGLLIKRLSVYFLKKILGYSASVSIFNNTNNSEQKENNNNISSLKVIIYWN